jgi:SAM-dependent methyltransferase
VVSLPDDAAAERVAAALGVRRAPPAPAAVEEAAEAGAPATPGQRAKQLAKRALEPVAARVLPRLARAVAPHVALTGAMAELDERIHHLDARMEALRAAWDLPTPPALAERIETNQELFKAELLGLRHALDEFGMAVAPAAGLDAAPGRMAELRARLDVLDKRVRSLLERSSPIPDADPVLPATFDYVGFEQRFRGDADVVLGRTQERYFDLLADAAPVLDVGCGRGEVLAALAERGVDGIGVDLDAGMVAEAKAAGVDARQGDALAFLADAEAGSFGAVIAIQVVEHLSLDALLALLELAYSKLRDGGRLVLETPNPASLVVLGNSYLLDPTHVRPLHPSLLSFLVERAGFADVRLEFYEPATGYHLDLLDEAEVQEPWVATVNAAFRRLNDVLFGPQDYAVIARR